MSQQSDQGVTPPGSGLRPFGVEPQASQAEPLVPNAVDIDSDFWRPGLRLRSGSPTMLQDEFAAFERQLVERGQ